MIRVTIESNYDFDTTQEIREAIKIKRGLLIPAKVTYRRDNIEIEISELTTEASATKKYMNEMKRKTYEKRGLNPEAD